MPVNKSTSKTNHYIDQTSTQTQKKIKINENTAAPASRANPQAQLMTGTTITQRLDHPSLAPVFTTFRKATASEKQTQGTIREIKPGLYVSHKVDDQDNIIFFAQEKMDFLKSETWDDIKASFNRTTSCLATSLKEFFKPQVGFAQATPEQLKSFYNITDKAETINEIIKQQNISKSNASKLVYHLASTTMGSSVFEAKAAKNETRYVTYASTTPIHDYAFQFDHTATSQYYQNLQQMKFTTEVTGHVSIVVSGGEKGECFEHRGIFKTPLAILNNRNADFKSKGIPSGSLSMALHEFGWNCAKKRGMKYFTVSPVIAMADIIKGAHKTDIQKGHIAIGLNQVNAKGWNGHLRDYEEEVEEPMVFDLRKIPNKLFA